MEDNLRWATFRNLYQRDEGDDGTEEDNLRWGFLIEESS